MGEEEEVAICYQHAALLTVLSTRSWIIRKEISSFFPFPHPAFFSLFSHLNFSKCGLAILSLNARWKNLRSDLWRDPSRRKSSRIYQQKFSRCSFRTLVHRGWSDLESHVKDGQKLWTRIRDCDGKSHSLVLLRVLTLEPWLIIAEPALPYTGVSFSLMLETRTFAGENQQSRCVSQP